MKKLFFLTTLLIVAIISCKKELNPNETGLLKNQIQSNQFYDYELKYDSIVKCAAFSLIDYLNHNTIKHIIYNKCLEQFDGDDNVLFKNLVLEFQNNNLDLKSLMISSLNNNNKSKYVYLVDECINGFLYFEDTLYCQVFLPEIDNYNAEKPHSVCYNLEDDEELPGFKIINNNVEEFMINETHALNYPVWVTSINETVDNNGNPIELNITEEYNEEEFKLYQNENLPNFSSKNNIKRTAELLNVKVRYVKVFNRKEQWGNGRGELAFAATHYNLAICINITKTYKERIAKIGKNDLNKWLSCSGDAYFAISYTGLRYENSIHVTYFEYDRRVKFNRQWVDIPCNNVNLYHNYKSKEPAYGELTPFRPIYFNDGVGGTVFHTLSNMEVANKSEPQ